jgi:alpha-glucosidase (family GH31 glycosyl hydrolase)
VKEDEMMKSILLCCLLVCLGCVTCLAEGVVAEGNNLVYRGGGQTITIQAWGRDSLRVRVAPDGGGQTSDWALDIPIETKGQIEISATEAVIRNGKISARIHDIPTRRGHMQFFRHSGDKKVCILSECDNVVDANNPGTRSFEPAGDGLFHSELQFAARDGERFYGMGENAKDAPGKVNLKGCVIDLYQRHMKAVVPFVVSSEGYGFLWNNPSLGKVEFGTNTTRWISYGSRQLDYFITAGDSYVDLGIRTFWLDPCDEFHEIRDYDQVLFHIGPAKEAHAYFVVAHQKNIYEGLLAAGEKEVATICRNAWAGSQRYGACPAPHDINSSFEDLEIYMKVGLNVMMSGIPWWSCDIGGFVTRDNKSPRFHELMVRWYQYGVFLPVFRTHGHRANNEAWTIGGDSYPHIRAAMLLRENLRPYVMEQMKLASKKGLPPMRPLFFDFKDDPKAAEVEDQFLFGPDIMAAPVTRYEVRSRDGYLPAGTEWTDAWTGKKLQGGRTVKADAPIEHIPVYVRGDNPGLLQLFDNLYEK